MSLSNKNSLRVDLPCDDLAERTEHLCQYPRCRRDTVEAAEDNDVLAFDTQRIKIGLQRNCGGLSGVMSNPINSVGYSLRGDRRNPELSLFALPVPILIPTIALPSSTVLTACTARGVLPCGPFLGPIIIISRLGTITTSIGSPPGLVLALGLAVWLWWVLGSRLFLHRVDGLPVHALGEGVIIPHDGLDGRFPSTSATKFHGQLPGGGCPELTKLVCLLRST